MSENIILTTGVYDLIKDQIKRKKFTKEQEEILLEKLKITQQVLRRELPTDVVALERKIHVKDHSTSEEMNFLLVAPKAAKVSKNKFSVLSDVGVATVGYKIGDVIQWPTEKGTKQYEILHVEPNV